jgi:hypothetical protein
VYVPAKEDQSPANVERLLRIAVEKHFLRTVGGVMLSEHILKGGPAPFPKQSERNRDDS